MFRVATLAEKTGKVGKTQAGKRLVYLFCVGEAQKTFNAIIGCFFDIIIELEAGEIFPG